MRPVGSQFRLGTLCVRAILPCALLLIAFYVSPSNILSADKTYGKHSDFNGDKIVDLEDLKIFSAKKLNQDWQDVEWCEWLEHDDKSKKLRGNELRNFIIEQFGCDQNEPPQPPEDPLALKNANDYPTRLTWGPNGKLFVSNPMVGSVFIYDAEMNPLGELKGLDTPLGVAVDDGGNIYVGNDGRDNIEVYSAIGEKLLTIADVNLLMPNDLALDYDGNIYVADSQSDIVRVYDPNGSVLGGIGEGELHFPAALTIHYSANANGQVIGRLYVADQRHYLVQVFDLEGNFLWSFGAEVSEGMMGWYWKGKFARLQSLAVDGLGRIHAADCYLNKVQILDIQSGAYIDSYGLFGTEPNQLNLPLDIAINDLGQVAVTNYGNKRVEIIYTVP